jgi:hypothetical protein
MCEKKNEMCTWAMFGEEKANYSEYKSNIMPDLAAAKSIKNL